VRIAALVKQIPQFEEMELGPDGRLRRDGIALEMNAYCRRAAAKAVEIANEHHGSDDDKSTVTVITLGPPSADDVLREAIAWGLDRGVDIDGVLVSDSAFAGSDTLATATALAAAIQHVGPFDLVLAGRNSVDADTGQVGPEVAELLDLPFLTGVRYLSITGRHVEARCEHDDGWVQAEVDLPAIVSCAERLTDPCKVDPDGRAAVPADHIRVLSAADLGPGPWGQAASPTWVGPVKVLAHERLRRRNADAPVEQQVRDAVALLVERSALRDTPDQTNDATVATAVAQNPDATIAVMIEPDRAHASRELLGAAARIAAELDGEVVAFTVCDHDARQLSSWGADRIVDVPVDNVEEDVAFALTRWANTEQPWAVLAPSTAWGREIASRTAAALRAGLTGDAVDLDVADGRLVAWKPAFGGQLVAAITATSAVQLVTVRTGMLPTPAPRGGSDIPVVKLAAATRGRVHILARTRDDDLDVLAEAHVVIGVGTGVGPDEYPALEPLRVLLGAELGATRKVTDKGWLPRARQIGITGRAIAPRLYVSIGASGKFNHIVGVRAAETVLAINPDPDALIFDSADVGIVADWRDALPLLVRELESRQPDGAGSGSGR
jgi:electron transfer flavoprotein alpha subunit